MLAMSDTTTNDIGGTAWTPGRTSRRRRGSPAPVAVTDIDVVLVFVAGPQEDPDDHLEEICAALLP